MLLDAVTLSDLEVFADSAGRGGLFALVDETQTSWGRSALRARLERPHSDPQAIRDAQAAVRFFLEHPDTFRLRLASTEALRRYLDSNIVLARERPGWVGFVEACAHALLYRDLFRELRSGVDAADSLLRTLGAACRSVVALDPPRVVDELARAALRVCERCAPSSGATRPPGVLKRDRLLRGAARPLLLELIDCVAELDALRAMARATANLGWTLPEILESEHFVLEAEGIFHPFVEKPVKNPIDLTGGEPMVFLTGPNMAGKTTYLRSAALVVLLGQMGMGVPADKARLTPVEVLLSSLNPSDNLRAGLSFFLSEVLRVRQAASHLAEGKRCFVLFDEVFKGTNVKDALEASAAVILGFAKARGSGAIFSSHLVELVEALEAEERIRFHCFEGRVVDGEAEYTYRMHTGVSDERLGLHLLKEARVPELIARIGA